MVYTFGPRSEAITRRDVLRRVKMFLYGCMDFTEYEFSSSGKASLCTLQRILEKTDIFIKQTDHSYDWVCVWSIESACGLAEQRRTRER